MGVLLAVDGGQTSTQVVLANEQGSLLAEATGGPSDHTEEPGGPERLDQVIRATVNGALNTAHLAPLDRQEFIAAAFGMTGETEIKRRVLASVIRTPCLTVVHDSAAALMAATAGARGVIVIAGTGSVARGTDGSGKECRVGGWGHVFGDEGSAFWIGREAVGAVAAELEGTGEKTDLTQSFCKRLGASDAYELMAKYYSGQWSREELAGSARWVHEAALKGDPLAERLLKRAGTELAALAIKVLSLLHGRAEASFEQGAPVHSWIVSYTGGVFDSGFVLSSFSESVRALSLAATIRPPLYPPVFGSLLLAYQSAAIPLSNVARACWPQRRKQPI